MMAFKFLTVAAVAVLSATVAHATDLPNKKAPPSAPVAKYSALWDGAYLGGSLGSAMTSGDESSLSGDNLRRAIPGIYGGYNYLLNSQIVVGVEGDLNYMGFEESVDNSIPYEGGETTYILCANKPKTNFKWVSEVSGCVGKGFSEVDPDIYTGNPRVPADPNTSGGADTTLTSSFSVRDLDTLRVRAGFLVQNNVLLFATAGLGVAHSELSTDDNGSVTSASGYHSGFVYGGGLEYAHSKDISFKVDYLHYDLGTIDDGVNAVDLVGNMIRAGVAYHF